MVDPFKPESTETTFKPEASLPSNEAALVEIQMEPKTVALEGVLVEDTALGNDEGPASLTDPSATAVDSWPPRVPAGDESLGTVSFGGIGPVELEEERPGYPNGYTPSDAQAIASNPASGGFLPSDADPDAAGIIPGIGFFEPEANEAGLITDTAVPAADGPVAGDPDTSIDGVVRDDVGGIDGPWRPTESIGPVESAAAEPSGAEAGLITDGASPVASGTEAVNSFDPEASIDPSVFRTDDKLSEAFPGEVLHEDDGPSTLLDSDDMGKQPDLQEADAFPTTGEFADAALDDTTLDGEFRPLDQFVDDLLDEPTIDVETAAL